MAIKEYLQERIFQLLMSLPDPVKILLAGGSEKIVRGNRLDPALQLMAHQSRQQPTLPELGVDTARIASALGYAALAGGRDLTVDISDKIFTSPQGDIPVRFFQPGGATSSDFAVLYFHAGGWVTGDLDTGSNFCTQFSAQTNATVVSVDYRLAPEHKFPAAIDDAMHAYSSLLDSLSELPSHPSRIVVAGESAGANLAAVLCHLARQKGLPQPAAQLLICPVTDVKNRSPSYQDLADSVPLNANTMEWFISNYLRNEKDAEDPRVSPLLAEDFSGLAPACIITAGFDPLLDEGATYAKRLKEAGVMVDYHCETQSGHGMTTIAGLSRSTRESCERTLAFLLDFIERALPR